MEVVTEQAQQTFQSLLTNVVGGCQQLLEQQRVSYDNKCRSLEQELSDLQLYKDVSLVNKLTVQVDQLQIENLQLKKRLRNAPQSQAGGSKAQSLYSAMTVPSIASNKSRPAIHRKEEDMPKPVTEPVQAHVVEEPVQAHVVEEPVQAVEEPTQVEAEQQAEEDPELDLFLVEHLESGQYFWEPESGNLYAKVSDEEAGDVVGKIKTVKVRDNYYYQDTIDNHVYEYIVETGDIGATCGRIVNGKFVKN
jgi:hypothetical protein